jgi:hypothetical protein
MRTYDDMMRAMLRYFPDAEVCEDNDGQLVVYTGKTLNKDLIVDFDPDLCSACDRPSLECSENPCDDVIADREA